MKSTIGLILLLAGMAVMVGGFAWAIWEFAGFYKAGLDNAMADGPEPKQVSSRMLTAAGIGLVGFVPMTVGSFMLGTGLLGLLKKRLQKRADSEPRR
ncbi:MAG TPA: hypothetical protein VFF65_12405 [Phycisphaerales bacterium]|nr:hypothetical protein [Phycisphaerales bacterium]